MPAYSFMDTMAAISGPNGAINLGPGSANTEGGITLTYTEDKSTMSVGADGEVMHSLHAGRSGTLVVRLQKTSPMNAVLSQMYSLDTGSTGTHGRNTISIKDLARGDDILCREVAFSKFPDLTYAKDGGEMTWNFHVGKIEARLGSGIAGVGLNFGVSVGVGPGGITVGGVIGI